MTDEMISPSALPEDVVEAQELRIGLLGLRDRGFRVFDKVFSRDYETIFSLSSLLNFGDTRNGYEGVLESYVSRYGSLAYRIRRNRYFDALARDGYGVQVFQSGYLNFCDSDAVTSCHTYYEQNLLDEDVAALLPAADRIVNTFLAALNFHSFSHKVLAALASKALPRGVVNVHYEPLASLVTLEKKLGNAIVAAPPGTAIFAHLMLPHSPWVLDRDCRYDPPGLEIPRTDDGLPDSRRDRYVYYGKQGLCFVNALARLLETPSVKDKLKDAIVLVHGDHGSRIVRANRSRDGTGPKSLADMKDLYPTFFAMRSPLTPPGIDPAQISLQDLFVHLVEKRRSDLPKNPDRTVFVTRDTAPLSGSLGLKMHPLTMPVF